MERAVLNCSQTLAASPKNWSTEMVKFIIKAIWNVPFMFPKLDISNFQKNSFIWYLFMVYIFKILAWLINYPSSFPSKGKEEGSINQCSKADRATVPVWVHNTANFRRCCQSDKQKLLWDFGAQSAPWGTKPPDRSFRLPVPHKLSNLGYATVMSWNT